MFDLQLYRDALHHACRSAGSELAKFHSFIHLAWLKGHISINHPNIAGGADWLTTQAPYIVYYLQANTIIPLTSIYYSAHDQMTFAATKKLKQSKKKAEKVSK